MRYWRVIPLVLMGAAIGILAFIVGSLLAR